jgi:hypothetical protein
MLAKLVHDYTAAQQLHSNHSTPQAATCYNKGRLTRTSPSCTIIPAAYPNPRRKTSYSTPCSPPRAGAAPFPPAPQDLPPLPNGDLDWLTPDKVDKRVLRLPPIDLGAKSLTMSLQCPMTYAIEKFRKFEYVTLWYFTEHGCQAARQR